MPGKLLTYQPIGNAAYLVNLSSAMYAALAMLARGALRVFRRTEVYPELAGPLPVDGGASGR
jgi:hypothetical protein